MSVPGANGVCLNNPSRCNAHGPEVLAGDGLLLPTSTEIDGGTTLSEVTDYLGRECRRASIDIGADELDLREIFHNGFEPPP